MPPSNAKRVHKPSSYREPPTPVDPTDKYAPNTWLNNGVGTTEDLLLPSGQLVLARRPGVEGLVKAGVLKNMDALTALVNEKHIKRVESESGPKDHVDMGGILGDEMQMEAITDVVDKVVCYCVVRPEVFRTPGDVTLRVPGVVYADMIDLIDKMFVFNFVVGGTRDFESFRGELSRVLGGVAVESDVPDPTE